MARRWIIGAGSKPAPRSQATSARTRYDHGFDLARSGDADMMSDMKTFTVRDLDRAPAIVLAACDRDGEARIRRRDGRIYRLMPAAGPKRAITSLPDFAARRRQVFKKPLSAAQTRLADEALRGE